jgi:glycerophosphoryl diester phosphodiesterase
LTEAAVHEAQHLGLRVLPWTVNDPAEMERVARWGVDGLITDRPDLALASPTLRTLVAPPRGPDAGTGSVEQEPGSSP